MKRPPELAIELYDMGRIYEAKVRYEQTGTDTAETFLILTSLNKNSIKISKANFNKYMDLHLGYNTIAELKPQYFEEVQEWKDHIANNEAEYIRYLELKRKFEYD